MKTRQKKNGLPIVQTTVQGISDESASTPLSSTEHSQKWRKAIYSNKSLHTELKKKDSLRKKLKAVENAMRRREDPERCRKKEREKKHKQHLERKKAKEVAAKKLTTPVKRKVKNLEPKFRRKYMKLSEKKSSKKGTSSSQVTPQNSKLIVSKVAQSLKAYPEILKGLNHAICMEIGVNISNPSEISQENEMLFQQEDCSLNTKGWQEHVQTQRKK